MSAAAAPTLLLVTPYLADANNGNWRTAERWSRLLAPTYRTILQSADAAAADGTPIAMIALHARRSRAAIERWKRECLQRPLIVVLTGTDLYRDLPQGDVATRDSIADADRLIVLQEDAIAHLPRDARRKADVVYQSARSLTPVERKAASRLNCVFVAHLRAEKDPQTVFEAWRRVPRDIPATLTIIGGALDSALADAARALVADDPRVKWLGNRPHAATRQAIRRAHILIVASKMEGGANVVVEAITSGTPVLASRMSGNLGMLGGDYPGYFPVGDADALAAVVIRARHDRRFLSRLCNAAAKRAYRFAPEAERAALLTCVERATVRGHR
ncbi:MAG TPA: selenoneine biosynthesis selenosugar synthase SenB [Casimicrobiaceae bacterium]|nr:selenoneine biosynthesis selenosugar synthase SenB [Casimicrobiaceae bacterium]